MAGQVDPRELALVRSHRFGHRLMTQLEYDNRLQLHAELAALALLPSVVRFAWTKTYAINHLRTRFYVHDVDDIPGADVPEALAWVRHWTAKAAQWPGAGYMATRAWVQQEIGGGFKMIPGAFRGDRAQFGDRPQWAKILRAWKYYAATRETRPCLH